jgi:hypothetical protein
VARVQAAEIMLSRSSAASVIAPIVPHLARGINDGFAGRPGPARTLRAHLGMTTAQASFAHFIVEEDPDLVRERALEFLRPPMRRREPMVAC